MTFRVGGEVDAFCTRCKMTLAHTILAIVGNRPKRVECNTCDGQHNYRGPAGLDPAVAKAAPSRPSRARVSFDDLLAKTPGPVRPYSIKTRFKADDLVEHPTFGRGCVAEVRADKVDILFRAGTKTLVHARA